MAAETTFELGFGTTFDPTNLETGLSKALARAEKETENSAAKQVAAVAKGALKEVKSIKAAENKKIEERKKSTQEQIELIRAMPDLTEAQKKRKIKAAEEAGREDVAKLERNLQTRLRLLQESVTDEVNLINEGAELKSRIDAVYESAQKEIEIKREAASAGIEERKKAAEEEIAAIQARTDLSEAEKQKQVEAVREAEQQKIEAVKSGLQEQIAKVKASTDARVKIIRDGARRERREIENGNRNNLRGIKDFGKGASQAMGGIGASMKKLAMGPVGIGAAVVLAGKQVKRFLNQTAEAWRVEEQAQIALAAAARNNPYLNDRGVHQLRQFANEMQRLTGIDNVQVMGAQTRLAALGRNQQEIEQIVRTAADIAATGLMSYDQAVDELSQSFSGFTRRLERMFPELKNLTEEAKMAGGAVTAIAESVSGMAEQAMQTGTGSVIAYRNAVEALRRSMGQDWETATRGFRIWATNTINRLTQMREVSRETREAAVNLQQEWARVGDGGPDEGVIRAQLRDAEAQLNAIQDSALRAATTAEDAGERMRAAFTLEGILQQLQIALTPWRDHSAHFVRDVEDIAANVENLREQVGLLDAIDRAVTVAERAVNAAEAEGSARAADAARRALEAAERARAAADAASAETHARAIEAEIQYIERLEEQGRIRAENLEYLEQEIEMIMQKAQIEGRGTRTLEVQRRVLNARINAYTNLVRQIGAAGEAERRTLEELQREYLRLEIETANRLQEDNLRGLENRRREIEILAELEGRATDSIRTQNELLDANINAYQNQMRILRDLIDGTREEEAARRAALEVQWRQYAQEKQTARAQRERLQEMIRLQDEVNQQARRLHEESLRGFNERLQNQSDARLVQIAMEDAERQGANRVEIEKEADRAIAFNRRQAFDRMLAEERRVHKEAIANADTTEARIEFERKFAFWQLEIHRRTADEIHDIYTEMMEGVYGRGARERVQNLSDMQIEQLNRVRDAYIAAIEARAQDEIRAEIRNGGFISPDDRARIEDSARQEIDAIHRRFAEKGVLIEEDRARRIKEINRQMVDDILAGFDRFLAATQTIANNINTIWTNSVNKQTQERLRANDEMDQSDEQRAANEQRILKKAAYERFKADLAAWTANVTLATAKAGLAVLQALASAPAPANIPAVILATLKGGTQVAAIASAKPTMPRFHAGGQVPGRIGQDVQVMAQGREIFIQPAQWKNTMQAMANLANMAYRPAAPAYNVSVVNNMGREARVSQSIDPKGIAFTIDQIVRDGISKGRYDGAFNQRDMRNDGRGLGTF